MLPLVSIIMPIRNEEIFINKCLSSILSQTYPKEYLEIIIVDGISNDKTREIIKSTSSDIINIKLFDNHKMIVPFGFNIGLSESIGDIIIRIDGHCLINDNYVQNCVDIIEKTGYDCVGGPIENSAKGRIGNLINLAQSSFFGVGGVDFRKAINTGKFVDTLAFGAYKREVFAKLGGYDEELKRNQDDEFNFRLIQNGGKIWLDPLIKSTYYPRTSIIRLFRQYFEYGLYKIRVFQKRKSVASIRHLVPACFVLLILILFLFAYLITGLPLIIFCFIYFISSLFSSIYEFAFLDAKKEINFFNLIFITPIIFFTLHFSYGLGTIFGLIKFINKWNESDIIDSSFNHEKFINRIS